MKQTVEEAAKEHQNKFETCDGAGTLIGFTNGRHKQSYESFIEGAKWMAKQSPWISVKERLPNNDENMFYTNYLSGALGVGFYVDEKWYQAYTGDYIYGITHWMPIPKFN